MVAVSYTHLDVYKRQLMEDASWGMEIDQRMNPSRKSLLLCYETTLEVPESI